MPDFDLPMTGDPEPEDETQDDPEALAAELDLGIDLSPEEKAAADEMVAHLKEQFGLVEPEVVDEDEPEPEPEPEVEPVEAEENRGRHAAPDPIPTPDVVVIDGREVPVSEARSLIDLRNYLAANPDKAQAVRSALEDKPPAPPEPPKAPEWLDQDDPVQVNMWQRQVELETQIAQIAGNQRMVAERQEQARAQADFETGLATFRVNHPELTEDDISKLRVHAVGLDIIDGLARKRSGADAISKALDIAYWDHPEFRAKASATPTPTEAKVKKATERKGKLDALNPTSSGSAPRQESRPNLSTDREARTAAAQWLREQNIL